MKVLVDTNVWLDVVLHWQPFEASSKAFLVAGIKSGIRISVAATSLKDIFCITERAIGVDAAYEAVMLILQIGSVAMVDGIVCKAALDLERPDYEDGIIAAAAAADGVDCIVTRDAAAFSAAETPHASPQEFLSQQDDGEVSPA